MKQKRAKLTVEGMTCSHCELMIEKKLLSFKGLSKAKASFGKGEVEFYYDDVVLSIDEIKKAINKPVITREIKAIRPLILPTPINTKIKESLSIKLSLYIITPTLL